MLRNVVLSHRARSRIRARLVRSQRRFVAGVRAGLWLSPEQHRIAGRKAWEARRDQADWRDSIERAQIASGLAYRKDELPFLVALQRRYRTKFRKERIGRRYFDFANETYLIEVSNDWGKGINHITARFADAKRDKRKRVAFVNMRWLGRIRRSRLAALSVDIVDIRTLDVERRTTSREATRSSRATAL